MAGPGEGINVRSWLFVPGDSERKLQKSANSPADALILDLEDSVAANRKYEARGLVAELLRGRRPGSAGLWVRINPLGSSEALQDLAAVVAAVPDGIVLPKADSPADVIRLGHYLDALEAQHGIERRIGILPIAAETARAPFTLGDYSRFQLPRMIGLTWGAEDLSAALGAASNQANGGVWDFTYGLARSLCLMAAKACGVQAIETVQADFRDLARLQRSSVEASREGFTGRLAIHPDQVEVINEAFTPSAATIEHARKVVALFGANPGAGVLDLNGAMVDLPHLKQALRMLDLQQASQSKPIR